jgi:hypothetical protein
MNHMKKTMFAAILLSLSGLSYGQEISDTAISATCPQVPATIEQKVMVPKVMKTALVKHCDYWDEKKGFSLFKGKSYCSLARGECRIPRAKMSNKEDGMYLEKTEKLEMLQCQNLPNLLAIRAERQKVIVDSLCVVEKIEWQTLSFHECQNIEVDLKDGETLPEVGDYTRIEIEGLLTNEAHPERFPTLVQGKDLKRQTRLVLGVQDVTRLVEETITGANPECQGYEAASHIIQTIQAH